jgi:leader peptidase (prepilin peptidase)/N-methyltransferase
MCPHCYHQLSSKDLVPIVSWITLKGKCRYCKKPISWHYPVVEMFFAGLLSLSYAAWPLSFTTVGWSLFGLWAILLVILVALSLYDLYWLELPTGLVYGALVFSFIFSVTLAISQKDFSIIQSSLLGSFLLGGLFWLLYQISGGKWIGGGDVRLGFAMGFFLGWQRSLLGLSLAAYIGTIVIIIAVVLGRYRRKMKLPFGPLLIAGWYICFLWGQHIIDWYLRLIGV